MQFNYLNTSGISEKDVLSASKTLAPYFNVLKKASLDSAYGEQESSIYSPLDTVLRKRVESVIKEHSAMKPSEVVVVGIGGSNLGARAIYDALLPNATPVTFIDTVHSATMRDTLGQIQWIYKKGGRVLLVVISKSGGTTEIIANARVLLSALKRAATHWHEDVVVITEPGSKLDQWALDNKVLVLPNYTNVGGRYSVLSPAGMFPLGLSGVLVANVHKGAARMLKLCIENNPKTNYALQSAVAVYSAIKKGKAIHDLFLFDSDLENLGKWNRQLTGESLGKQGKGILPTVSIGSIDLHSVAQLYLGGPNNVFTTFVWVKKKADVPIPKLDPEFDALVPELNKISLNRVMTAVYEGTKQAYRGHGRLFTEVVLEKISAEELGAFMQFKMVETMLLGKLLGVNAFNQPNVEEYKKITRKLLK